jgi:hypothetical protein
MAWEAILGLEQKRKTCAPLHTLIKISSPILNKVGRVNKRWATLKHDLENVNLKTYTQSPKEPSLLAGHCQPS